MTAVLRDGLESEAIDRSGTTVDRRYEILRTIGAGTTGVVYEARQLGLDKRVAIKIIHPHLVYSKALVARFVDEARNAAVIRHPNVVDITDSGEMEGLPYFVMEYLEGLDLESLVKTSGPLPWHRALGVLRQVALGLEAAHLAGVIHRDLEPRNCLLLSPSDPDQDVYWVKVSDFGIGKLITGRPRGPGPDVLLGNPHYMAPELATLGEADERCDIYALGVMAYTILAGKVPFDGPTPFSILNQHLHATPTALRDIDPAIPTEVEAWVERAMSKDPMDRFETMTEARRELTVLDPSASQSASVSLPTVTSSGSGSAVRPTEASHSDLPLTPPPRRHRSRTPLFVMSALCSAVAVTWIATATPASTPRELRLTPLTLAPVSAPNWEPEALRIAAASLPLPSADAAPREVWLAATPSAERSVHRPAGARHRAAPAPAVAAPDHHDDALPPMAPNEPASASPSPSIDPDRAEPPEPPQDPACNVPFVVDGRGFKRFKRECLESGAR